MHIVEVFDLVFGVNGHCDVRLGLFLLLLFFFYIKYTHVNKTTSIHANILYIHNFILTFSRHRDPLGLLAWFTDPCGVVGSDAEAVPTQRPEARADVVGCVFTKTGCHGPALGPVLLLPDLHLVAQHGRASVVAGTRPGEDQRLGAQLGNDGLGCWWGGPV